MHKSSFSGEVIINIVSVVQYSGFTSSGCCFPLQLIYIWFYGSEQGVGDRSNQK